jgi:hypothetical protein
VAENVRPPVAIRIVRPYESEDELLEHELETVGKTSVVLIGAHPRPTGVILRFEVTLASGTTVLRGEGRVLAHKENAFRGQPGLTLRFTRLDPRSKSVVDRATAMREARSVGDVSAVSSPSRPAPVIPLAEGALADALTASTPAPGSTAERSPSSGPGAAPAVSNADQEAAVASVRASAREKANATARANAKRTGSARPMALTPPPVPVAVTITEPEPEPEHEHVPERAPEGELAPAHAAPEEPATPAPTPVTSIPGEVRERSREALRVAAPEPSPRAAAPPVQAGSAAPGPINAPPDRAELLARLRDRAGKLAPERVQAILAARARS